jgi:hypothetical protein
MKKGDAASLFGGVSSSKRVMARGSLWRQDMTNLIVRKHILAVPSAFAKTGAI